MLNTTRYVRRPFDVEAVQVSEENIQEVSNWCLGQVRTAHVKGEVDQNIQYIKVRVDRPLNERQTRAYIGDWVLMSPQGFKVYTSKAFEKSFVEQKVELLTTLEEQTNPLFK